MQEATLLPAWSSQGAFWDVPLSRCSSWGPGVLEKGICQARISTAGIDLFSVPVSRDMLYNHFKSKFSQFAFPQRQKPRSRFEWHPGSRTGSETGQSKSAQSRCIVEPRTWGLNHQHSILLPMCTQEGGLALTAPEEGELCPQTQQAPGCLAIYGGPNHLLPSTNQKSSGKNGL